MKKIILKEVTHFDENQALKSSSHQEFLEKILKDGEFFNGCRMDLGDHGTLEIEPELVDGDGCPPKIHPLFYFSKNNELLVFFLVLEEIDSNTCCDLFCSNVKIGETTMGVDEISSRYSKLDGINEVLSKVGVNQEILEISNHPINGSC